MLKQGDISKVAEKVTQPPSGGWVLKLGYREERGDLMRQPPSGGCVLKLQKKYDLHSKANQPPSGGCVLKLPGYERICKDAEPAAFRRLCVETSRLSVCLSLAAPAAFRRLCVETHYAINPHRHTTQPPSGGCVLKPSRLAAVVPS